VLDGSTATICLTARAWKAAVSTVGAHEFAPYAISPQSNAAALACSRRQLRPDFATRRQAASVVTMDDFIMCAIAFVIAVDDFSMRAVAIIRNAIGIRVALN
jgi:hypothetical protein